MTGKTLVFLRRPQMTAAFDVVAVAVDDQAGRLEGEELERVAKFIRASDGAPQFDLECEGKLFSRCRWCGGIEGGALPFWYDTLKAVEPSGPDPVR